MPGFAPAWSRNKVQRDSADLPTVDEVVARMSQARGERYAAAGVVGVSGLEPIHIHALDVVVTVVAGRHVSDHSYAAAHVVVFHDVLVPIVGHVD
jgi:hypothetical protein